jgi:hypothetical protein
MHSAMPHVFLPNLQEIAMFTRFRQPAIVAALGSVVLAASLSANAQSQAPAANAGSAGAASQSAPATQPPSLRQVYDTLEAAGYTDIRQIERERDRFEAKARDRDGKQVKVYVDPASGAITTRERSREERHDD